MKVQVYTTRLKLCNYFLHFLTGNTLAQFKDNKMKEILYFGILYQIQNVCTITNYNFDDNSYATNTSYYAHLEMTNNMINASKGKFAKNGNNLTTIKNPLHI